MAIYFATGKGFHASPANAYKFIITAAPSWCLFFSRSKKF
jgi:hypothetical protein